MSPEQARIIAIGKAEFERQCAALDEQVAAAQQKGLRDAYAALVRGDTAERDRICRALARLPEATRKAKLEIGLRIGEELGISREGAEAAYNRHTAAS